MEKWGLLDVKLDLLIVFVLGTVEPVLSLNSFGFMCILFFVMGFVGFFRKDR